MSRTFTRHTFLGVVLFVVSSKQATVLACGNRVMACNDDQENHLGDICINPCHEYSWVNWGIYIKCIPCQGSYADPDKSEDYAKACSDAYRGATDWDRNLTQRVTDSLISDECETAVVHDSRFKGGGLTSLIMVLLEGDGLSAK